MKQLVVISGKGGTGKTSVTASFAALADNAVIVDCDVDAADLHLVLQPQVQRQEAFTGGSKARIDPLRCMACGRCAALCRFEAISFDGLGRGSRANTYRVSAIDCEGCGVCCDHCPQQAIEFQPAVRGQWYVSHTRHGPLVHARLEVAAENSGKLVSQLRRTAQQLATEQQRDLILCDGPPGLGCPVLASLTGASLAVFVVEPTASGRHDFLRVAELAEQLGVPGLLAVNKADLNESVAENLEQLARRRGIAVAQRLSYDREVIRAQLAGKAVVEVSAGPAARAIRRLWAQTRELLDFGLPVINLRREIREDCDSACQRTAGSALRPL